MSLLGAIMAGSKSSAPFDVINDISWYAVYQAEDCSSVGNGNEVTTWPDATSNSRDMTTPSAQKPVYTSSDSSMNNQPVIAFSDPDYIQSSSAVFGDLAAPLSFVLIGGLTARTSGTNDIFVDTVSTSRRIIMRAGSSNFWQLVSNVNLYGGSVDTNRHFFAGYVNGTNSDLQVDASIYSGSSGTDTQGLNGLTIGSRYEGGVGAEINIGFVGIYNGDIFADAKWAQFKSWATTKYGITTS